MSETKQLMFAYCKKCNTCGAGRYTDSDLMVHECPTCKIPMYTFTPTQLTQFISGMVQGLVIDAEEASK